MAAPHAYHILPPLVSARTGELVLQENLLAHCEIPKETFLTMCLMQEFDGITDDGSHQILDPKHK